MTRRRKILFVVCLLVLLAALPLAAMLLLPWDATPPDDADLLIQRDAIPDAENGYALFEEAAARAFLPRGEDETAKIDAALGNEGWDDEFINGLVSKNQAALDLWRQGMARPRFQAPGPGPQSWSRIIPNYCELGEVICLDSRALFEGGRERESLDQAARLAEFGLNLSHAKGELVDYLVGLTVESLALDRLRWDASTAHLPPAEMKEYITHLGRLRDGGQGYQDAVRADYAKTAALLDLMQQGAIGANLYTVGTTERYLLRSGYHFQPNSTRRIIIENYRRLMALAPKPYSQTAAWFNQLQTPLRARKSVFLDACSLLTPNCLGQRAAFNLTNVMTSAALICKKESFQLEALRLAIAIRCFEQTTGRLPQKLDELVPEWIDAVPLDDFDGKPIRWSAARKLLWSVGKDLIDDGGDGCEDESVGSCKDLVFHLDPKDAKKVEEGASGK